MIRLPFRLRGFLYELRRGLLNPALLVILLLMVGVSLGIVTSFHASSGSQNYESCQGVEWYDGSAFHFEIYVHDENAHPVAGVLTNITLTPGQGSASTAPVYLEGHTTSSGTSELVARLPGSVYNYTFFAVDPNSSAGVGTGACQYGFGYGTMTATLSSGPPGSVHAFAWGMWGIVGLDLSPPTPQLLLFFLGPNGTSPAGDQVFWAGAYDSGGRGSGPNPFPALPESAMNLLGTLQGTAQVFSLSVPNATWTGCYECGGGQVIQLEIFSPSGQLLLEDTNVSANTFAQVPQGLLISQEEGLTFSFLSTYVGFFAPLMAIAAGYALYARDRVSGVLETAQCGPISREGLILSRWAAVFGTLTLSLVLSLAIISIELHSVLGVYLPASVVVTTLGAMLVEVGAFSGLVMFVSRLVRSHVVVLGAGFGAFFGFEIGWGFLDSYVRGLPVVYYASTQVTIDQLELLNPLGMLSLLSRIYLNPPLLGVTAGEIALSGFLWIVVPLVLLVLHARTRD